MTNITRNGPGLIWETAHVVFNRSVVSDSLQQWKKNFLNKYQLIAYQVTLINKAYILKLNSFIGFESNILLEL